MVLRSAYLLIAQRLQEAADMAHSDVRSQLNDAVSQSHKGTGTYASYLDHTGDGTTGDCIYSCYGDGTSGMKKAPYEISKVGDKTTASLDTKNAVSVIPQTTYAEQADEDDHYAQMMERLVKDKIYTAGELPLFERFISKSERDGADEASFAGKGKSFPILKPSDVGAAVHAMGRAGSANYGMAQLKANIIRIAKAKGFGSELPKAWQGTQSSESAVVNVPRGTTGELKLFESASALETIKLTEAKADYEIKLIAPGKGSSAFYPAEVLKRDGPKVFKAGTHVYLNHQTAAEEAQRPEGDVRNLAGVLSSTAVYHENHAKGPGLYGRMKVFQDHAQLVEEKAAHVGMSIRASGLAESGKSHEGLPVLKELTGAESVDVVTRAGAGGMILTESARTQEVSGMDATELKALQESVKAANDANAKLLERALKGDAREEAARILAGISLHEAAKVLVIENVLRDIPQKDGVLDTAKFTEAVNSEAKRVGAVVSAATGSGQVNGMGAGAPIVPVTETRKPEEILAHAVKTFQRMGLSEAAAKRAALGRVA